MTLLSGPSAERARGIVADIATALRDPAVYDTDPGLRTSSLGRGAAGAAVFFAEYAQETGDERDAETALAFLDAALDQAAEEQPTALLYPGSVGVGWMLAYLSGSLLEPDDPAPNDVDELVTRAVTGAAWPSADLIRGVTGTGVYLLERPRAPHVLAALDDVVTALAKMAETTDTGTTWYVAPEGLLEDRRALYPNGLYDVGMAHGQAGMVTVLAGILTAGVEPARPLLESATAWLLAQRLPDDAGPGRYPLIIGKGETHPHGGRLAWCYGDPGVAIALLAAGQALGDDAILREAHATALAATRRTAEDGTVVDAPLCHGSAGLMHVFSRLATGTGDATLADKAREWFDLAVAQRRVGEPVAGYGAVRSEPSGPEYLPTGGFLEGAAGVGLALISATTERDPGWDRVLLTKPVTS